MIFFLNEFWRRIISTAFSVFLLCSLSCTLFSADAKKLAESVIIHRDNYGVPHIQAKTDAAAVFGLMYAQAEDNFWQLEEDHINKLGRSAEIYGASRLTSDMMLRLFESNKIAQEEYRRLPETIKVLCDAYAAGLNYYLETHPEVKPRLITKYEPWFPLITGPPGTGGQGISQREVRALFPELNQAPNQDSSDEEGIQEADIGSNMWAVSPKKSASGNALLFINPHVRFFGGGQRYEAHLQSGQGLNISGFAMLGMPYIWTGFNENLGWSQTNSYADTTDVYLETFDNPNDPLAYRVGDKYLKAFEWTEEIPFSNQGVIEKKKFTFRKTHRGSVVGIRDGKYLVIRAAQMEVGSKLFRQKWGMARARNLNEFKAALSIRALTGSNTIYADNKGNIFYLHGNAVPRRNIKYDWTKPLDGTDPETDWKGFHELNELPQVLNPEAGFVQNCNSTPFLTSATNNPDKSKIPGYMAPDLDTLRSQRSRQILSSKDKFTFEEWAEASLNTNLVMPETLVPELNSILVQLKTVDSDRAEKLAEPLAALVSWNYEATIDSIPTTVFMMYFEQLQRANRQNNEDNDSGGRKTLIEQFAGLSAEVKLAAFEQALDGMRREFGDWKIKWGEINRLQRVHSSGIQEKFDDSKMSLPVPGTNGQVGSVLTFGSRREAGQKKRYGISGNSYLAVVEFGKRVNSRSLLVFGQSADPNSSHFFDQAELYSNKKYKRAWLYPEDVKQNSRKSYHPGK